MKLHLFEYECRPENRRFTAPEIVGGYGVFLLRSEAEGHEAYVEALSDDAFAEAGRLVDESPRAGRLSEQRRAELTRAVFSVACDPAPDGTPYMIGRKPRCPFCGSHDVQFLHATEPPEFADLELPTVTHRKWASLSAEERRRLVDTALQRVLQDGAGS
jgi:hypothetical protein